MRTDIAADAAGTDGRGSSNDNSAIAPPDEPRRRWRWPRFGEAFLDGPTDDRYANLWLFSCGQGG